MADCGCGAGNVHDGPGGGIMPGGPSLEVQQGLVQRTQQ